jgi:hypothetical protein
MGTPVFLTVDTELVWRHHTAGMDPATLYERSFEPAGVGISYQLARLKHYGLKATFFVDPMPALALGIDPIRRIVATILAAGQEVQLHLHPNWADGYPGLPGPAPARFEMIDYSRAEQSALIAKAKALLVAAGAPDPIAFRAGCYSANDDTLAALATLGFDYDSSHNGAEHPWPGSIGLPALQMAPVAWKGLVEVPVTVIQEPSGVLRNFQICALSSAEMRAALDHAIARRHAAVTIISHGFELANRPGTGANAIHVSRFEALCAMLADARDQLDTVHFADRPRLRLDADDVPLAPHNLRRCWRHAEQLWSNFVLERAA